MSGGEDEELVDDDVPSEFADFAEMLARAADEEAKPAKAPLTPEIRERRRRRRRRAWFSVGASILVIVLAVGSYVGVILSAPLPSTAAVLVTLVPEATPALQIRLPENGASAVSVTGAEGFAGTKGTDGILAASGGNEPRPIASISKLITTLVILEKKPIAPGTAGPTITFTRADHKLYDAYYVRGATIQPMKTGSTMSLRDALELMLVVSASNYAEAVSTWAFGSQANFLAAAHRWLAKNGLTGTTFVDPSGIDPRNTSTPTDLLTLGRIAMANPLVASLVQLQTTDVSGFEGLPNTNGLLGSRGVDGIKTGTLDGEGSSLLFSTSVDVGAGKPIKIMGVILGDLDHASADIDATAIIDDVRAGFHAVPLVKSGDVVGSYTTVWGETKHVVAEQSAALLTWSDSPITARSHAKSLTIADARTIVGSASFAGEGGTVSVRLVLTGAIKGPDAWWRITHPAELFGR